MPGNRNTYSQDAASFYSLPEMKTHLRQDQVTGDDQRLATNHPALTVRKVSADHHRAMEPDCKS